MPFQTKICVDGVDIYLSLEKCLDLYVHLVETKEHAASDEIALTIKNLTDSLKKTIMRQSAEVVGVG